MHKNSIVVEAFVKYKIYIILHSLLQYLNYINEVTDKIYKVITF